MINIAATSARTPAETKPRSLPGVLGGLFGGLALSAVLALLVGVAVAPPLALAGLAAANGITDFENLPDYLAIGPLSQRSNIYATPTNGPPVLLATFYDQNRVEVSSDQISQSVKDAVVAGEDPRFYEHGGIDLQGTIRAIVSTVTGRDTQGGSSITQQYVKNVLVQKCELLSDTHAQERCYTQATETTADRKLKEMRLAIGVEKAYTKAQILQGYLNITGFGGTVYGIEAAANYYYGTSAAELTLAQAASLIAIVNNPVKFQLDEPDSTTNGAANGYAANKSRRNYILAEMYKYKKITRTDYIAALKTPIEPSIHEPSTGCQTAGDNAFFCDYVTNVLQNDPTFGDSDSARMLNFKRGGYDVYTTLDTDLQAAAVKAIQQNVPQTYPGWDVGGVATSVQVGTGRVLVMAQNKEYSQDPSVAGPNITSLNYNTDYDYGGSSGFQPGSTYKIFTLAEWLKEGHTLNETVDSRVKANWGTFRDSCLGPQNYDSEHWSPKNDSSSENGANYSALQSTINSINTGYIGMAKKLDLCGIRKTAESFDMHRADGTPLLQSAASVIGTNEVAPLSVAVAFAGIANKGVTCSPIAIDKIIGANGTAVPVPQSTCTESVTPAVVGAMDYALQRVLTSGTAVQSWQSTSPRVPMIGKTGTTDGNKDTWMSGASTKVATVVAVVSLSGAVDQRLTYFNGLQAATARHRMWPMIMSVANAKYGGGSFPSSSPNAVVSAGH